jgi:hypothetical protein
MFGATKMFALDNATTIFVFPVGYLTDHVSREQLYALYVSLPAEWFWVEGLELTGMAYEISVESLAGLDLTNVYIAKDFSRAIKTVEPSLDGAVVKPADPQLTLIAYINGAVIGDDARALIAEVEAIPYPEFGNLTKPELQSYIDTWNNIYPDNQIVPEGTYKQDLLDAILLRVGIADEPIA